MPPSLPAALSLLLIIAHPAAQSDSPFVAWARGHIASLDSPVGAFKALDSDMARVQLIGVGESVHEVQPFLEFRFQLLQHLVRNLGVTALVLESGLPEAMALDDYVGGRTASVDFDAVLPGGFGSLAEIRRTTEWLREWNIGQGRRRPVSVYGADLPASAGSMVPALDRLEDIVGGHADSRRLIGVIRPVAERASGAWWRAAAEKYDALPADVKAGLTSDIRLLTKAVDQSFGADAGRREWARRLARVLEQHEACCASARSRRPSLATRPWPRTRSGSSAGWPQAIEPSSGLTTPTSSECPRRGRRFRSPAPSCRACD